MKRFVVVVAVGMLLAFGGATVMAQEAFVDPGERILEFLDDHGVTLEMLETPRVELSRVERALVGYFLQEDVQSQLNDLVYSELMGHLLSSDEVTIATMVIGTVKWRLGAL